MTGDGDRDGPGDASPKDERDDRPELDVDAAFAAIVAGFGRPSPAGVGPWPAAEDARRRRARRAGRRGARSGGGSGPPRRTDRSGAGTAGGAAERRAGQPARPAAPPHRRTGLPGDEPGVAADGDPDDDGERFMPPEAPPIASRPGVAAGLAGGDRWPAVPARSRRCVWRALPRDRRAAPLGAFVGGFVTLVARMPRDHGDDGDDGAVV